MENYKKKGVRKDRKSVGVINEYRQGAKGRSMHYNKTIKEKALRGGEGKQRNEAMKK